jgi:hypothetical protein
MSHRPDEPPLLLLLLLLLVMVLVFALVLVLVLVLRWCCPCCCHGTQRTSRLTCHVRVSCCLFFQV